MSTTPSGRLDLLVGALLALLALVLFGHGITVPQVPYFDETHYVPAARKLLALGGPTNIEHPLFAKTLMAAGIALLGDNPLGWRLPGMLCAVAGVVAFYAIGLNLFRDRRVAACAALLLIFNQTYFIQARIAMLEMPMTAALLMAGAYLLRGSGESERARIWRYAGAVFLGLAIAAKWLAVPYCGLFLGLSYARRWRETGPGRAGLREDILPEAAKVTGLTLAVYFASFWPAFFYHQDAMTLRHLVPFQFEMLARQRAPLSPHPYQSNWWQWPLMLRPIWYLFEKTQDAYRAVLLIGNPVIYWGGLAAACLALSGWIKDRGGVLWLCLGLYLFSLGMWIVIPKPIGFFYYYNLAAIALCLLIPAVLSAWPKGGRSALVWVTAASGAMFFHFYPIIAAQPLPTDDTWTDWVWMESWY